MTVVTQNYIDELTAQAVTDGIPNAAKGGPYCNSISPVPRCYICTCPPSHEGDHVAHTSNGTTPMEIVDRWPQ